MFKLFAKNENTWKNKVQQDTSLKEFFQKYNKIRESKDKSSFCFAADKGLYFRQNGDVTACCMNHWKILGHYPEQSIKEIWGGQEVRELRESLKNYNLFYGCFHCYEQLSSGNFHDVNSLNYDKISGNKRMPAILEFELDHKCNLNCIMCFLKYGNVSEAPNSLYDDSFCTQLDYFLPHIKQASFYGGEPFFIEAYYRIWDKLSKVNPSCNIFVQTNGTILTEKVKTVLEKGVFNIGISIEAVDKVLYEKIRVGASYEKVIENINFFLEYSKKQKTYFGISVCPITENWENIPDILNFCNQLGIRIFFNTVLEPFNHSLWLLDYLKQNEIIDYLKSYSLPEDNEINKHNRSQYNSLIIQLESWRDASIKRAETAKVYANKGNEELEEQLLNKLLIYNEKVFNKHTDSMQKTLKRKIDSIINYFDNDEKVKEILIKINCLPIQYLIEVIDYDTKIILQNIIYL